MLSKVMQLVRPVTVVVKLPWNFNRKSVNVVLDEIFDESLELRCNKVAFDFHRLNFIDPIGVTVLSNVIEYLRSKGVSWELRNYSSSSASVQYLDDSGFFEYYLGHKLRANAALRRSTLPLKLLPHQRSHSWLESSFTPWMRSCADVSEDGDNFATIKVCLTEIFNNTRDHSGLEICSVYGQYFPQEKCVVLAISDFGVGIPTNVKRKADFKSDSEAILTAMREGFTTQSSPRNRGAGLDVLIKNVVRNNGGAVYIRSLHGAINTFKTAGGFVRSAVDSAACDAFYPGTLIEVKIYTELLEKVEEKEVFTW